MPENPFPGNMAALVLLEINTKKLRGALKYLANLIFGYNNCTYLYMCVCSYRCPPWIAQMPSTRQAGWSGNRKYMCELWFVCFLQEPAYIWLHMWNMAEKGSHC